MRALLSGWTPSRRRPARRALRCARRADGPGARSTWRRAWDGDLTRPLVIGQRPEQPRHLLVLGDDGVAEVRDRLATSQAGRAKALLVEVGEERIILVEEPPDPETLDVDDDVAQVGQRFQPGPLAGAGWPGEPVRRRRVHGRRTASPADRMRSRIARCSGVMQRLRSSTCLGSMMSAVAPRRPLHPGWVALASTARTVGIFSLPDAPVTTRMAGGIICLSRRLPLPLPNDQLSRRPVVSARPHLTSAGV